MTTLAVVALLAAPMLQAATAQGYAAGSDLGNKVRHELVMLPYYGVFDNMTYNIDDNGVVTLGGQVTRPTLKSGAERVVQNVEGVRSVVNNIEVLPLSNYDDRVRLAVARSVYGFTPLQRYAWGAQPPIRIIVKNGVVTLEGFVTNEGDRDMAGIRANAVSGVFQVHNKLHVEQASS